MTARERDPEFQPLSVSNTEDNILNFNALVDSPIVTVLPWISINSSSKLWLHCECTYKDGTKGIIKLAEAATIETSADAPAFSCELPLEELSKLGDNTDLTFILMESNDGSRDEHSIKVVRYSLIFQHPFSINNPSRWMTDIGPIEYLKIHDVIMPMAHNAGVDQEGAGWPADWWAACQDDTFHYQLANGIRALDLRLHRDGTKLMFKHGGYDAGRELRHCLASVSEFVQRNPGEIVILNFHELTVDDWNFYRVVDNYTSLYIPPSARNLTIGQIRNRYPGRSIIIARDNGNGYCWPKINGSWTGDDFNQDPQIAAHITEEMRKFPKNTLRPIFACGYAPLSGPIRYPANASFWNAFFSKLVTPIYRQSSIGNMINVDFFEGTGVVDRCIFNTTARAIKAHWASATQLTASIVSSNSIRLTWVRPVDAGVTGYSLHANDQFVADVTGTEYVFSGLPDGFSYIFQVLPRFADGFGAPTEIRCSLGDVTKPGKPTDLSFQFFGDFPKASLNWIAAIDNVAVSKYQIYYNDKEIASVDGKTHFYLINVADKGTYRVRAVDAAGNFADSDPLVLPPDALPGIPTNLRLSFDTDNNVTLKWEAAGDGIPITGYDIWRSGTTFSAGTSPVYVDPTVYMGRYTYMVRARNGVLHSGFSNQIHVTLGDATKPSKPTNLNFTFFSDQQQVLAILSWNASSDNVAVKEYHIYRDHVKIGFVEVNKHIYLINFADKGTYRVRAVDTADNYADSDPLVLPPDAMPGAPTHLRASSVTNNSVTLEWNAAGDGVPITGYEISRNGTSFYTDSSTVYVDRTVGNGPQRYLVYARNGVLRSAGSNDLRVDVDGIPPSKPTNLRAMVMGQQTFLAWDKSTDNVGVTQYEITRNRIVLGTVDPAPGDWQAFIADDVVTPWEFKVRALDAAGGYTDSDLLIGP